MQLRIARQDVFLMQLEMGFYTPGRSPPPAASLVAVIFLDAQRLSEFLTQREPRDPAQNGRLEAASS